MSSGARADASGGNSAAEDAGPAGAQGNDQPASTDVSLEHASADHHLSQHSQGEHLFRHHRHHQQQGHHQVEEEEQVLGPEGGLPLVVQQSQEEEEELSPGDVRKYRRYNGGRVHHYTHVDLHSHFEGQHQLDGEVAYGQAGGECLDAAAAAAAAAAAQHHFVEREEYARQQYSPQGVDGREWPANHLPQVANWQLEAGRVAGWPSAAVAADHQRYAAAAAAAIGGGGDASGHAIPPGTKWLHDHQRPNSAGKLSK